MLKLFKRFSCVHHFESQSVKQVLKHDKNVAMHKVKCRHCGKSSEMTGSDYHKHQKDWFRK